MLWVCSHWSVGTRVSLCPSPLMCCVCVLNTCPHSGPCSAFGQVGGREGAVSPGSPELPGLPPVVKDNAGWPSSWGETHPHTAHPVKTLWRQEGGDPVSISPSFATRKSFPLSLLSPSCCTGARFLLRGRAAVKEPLGTEPAWWGLGLPDADSYFCLCPVHMWPCSRRPCDLLWWPHRDPGRCA